MTYTQNYHLPQWVKEDRIMMDDFNQMCQNMENGLLQNASAAASDASKASAAAAAAHAAANQAAAAAAAAQATADAAYAPGKLPYVFGTYDATGSEQKIFLGFQPQFLFVICPTETSPYLYFTLVGAGLSTQNLELTATGFTVKTDIIGMHSTLEAPQLNINPKKYIYIAFR